MNDHRDIFISYSNENREKVDSIVKAINFFGVSCWYQLNDSKKDFLKEINNGIKNSKAFVVFVSKESIDSIMVRNEINRAISELKSNKSYKILPVVIDEISDEDRDMMQLLLGSFNWLYEKEYQDFYALALAIFNQIELVISNPENYDSIYSASMESEKKRIKAQNELFLQYATPHLDSIFSNYSKQTILDVGCADAKNICSRLENRDYKLLLGIDKDSSKIEEALCEFPDERNKFISCDITTEELSIILNQYLIDNNIKGFDIIHIASVLLHIKNPKEVLKTLHTFLNEGGTMFIQEEDDGLNLSYPSSTFFENCFYIWEHSLESGDRKMGRKIPLLLKESGYKDIKLLSGVMSSVDFDGAYKEALWDMYFNPELWATDSASYFDSIEAFNMLEEYHRNHPQFKEDYMNGKIFITLGNLFFTAKK